MSAETQAALEALDAAWMLTNYLSEVLPNSELKIELYTDSKSLYDCVRTTNLLTDKRLRVDVAAIREMVESGEVIVCWVEGRKQLADILTKSGPSKQNLLEILTKCRLA